MNQKSFNFLCILYIFLFLNGLCVFSNPIRIYSQTGSALTNRSVSIACAFKQGDIPHFAEADVPEITQCDVKNRWSDGSLRFAILSFVIPQIPITGVDIHFSDQNSGQNTGELFAGWTTLSEAQKDAVLDNYQFEAKIQIAGQINATVAAREMLKQGRFRYWLKGPIVTSIILEDQDPSLPYDLTKGLYPLHPIFEAWFYPDNHTVDLGYILENMWASHSAPLCMQDVTYSLILKSGLADTTVFTHPSFKHIGKSRWHKRFWVGGDPGEIFIDHNVNYMASARVIPNYDTTIRADESLIASRYAGFDANNDNFAGTGERLGGFEKGLNAGGAADWIGLLSTWDTLHLLNMDIPDSRLPAMTFGNADMAGRIPMHFRERDQNAGTGQYFDSRDGLVNGTVETFGRVISINARRQLSLWQLNQTCDSPVAQDSLALGNLDDDGWGGITRDHMPDPAYLAYLLSGRYYYLDELQQWAAYVTAHGSPCYTGDDLDTAYNRQGHNGFLHDSQLRGNAWGLRTLVYGAFMSPDGTVEKDYFEDKLFNNIAEWEGIHDIDLTLSSKENQWQFGQTMRRDSHGISPLGSWGHYGGEFIQPPLKQDGSLLAGASPWEENFFICAMGMAKQFGYPVDSLMQFLARRPFNILKNPDTVPYLIEAYRYPTITTNDQWVSSWSAFDDYYASVPSSWIDETHVNTDHSYGYIALSAIAFLYSYTVDDIQGAEVWDTYFNDKGDLWHRERLASYSPKWSIMPHIEEPTPQSPLPPSRLRLKK